METRPRFDVEEVIRVKSVAANDGERFISGIATSPTIDRMGDIIDPLGVKFAAEMPLLLNHDSTKVVGTAKFGNPTKQGIPFEASIVKENEPGILKDLADYAWHQVKNGLIASVSIGFRVLNDAVEGLKTGGLRFSETEVMELSLVPIPANPDAKIYVVKSFYQSVDEARAASGRNAPIRLSPPGVSGKTLSKPEGKAMATYQEQVASFESKRAATMAAIDNLLAKASEEGRTFTDAEQQEHDELDGEIKQIDKHLVVLRAAVDRSKENAKPAVENKSEPAAPATVRHGDGSIRHSKNLPDGIGMARYVKAFAFAKGNYQQAAEYAKQWETSTPEVALALKTAISAGTTTDSSWAGPLVYAQDFPAAFLDYLRPKTIIGKITGLSQVPFNIRYGIQNGGSTVGWVGQGAPKPVSKLSFTSGSLGFAKAAGIVVITQELARFSSPSAELKVRDDLTAQMAYFLDQQFIDPSVAAVANVSPASVLNGAANVRQSAAAWTSMANVVADVKALQSTFAANEISLEGAYWVMTPDTALSLGWLLNTGGTAFAFPDINVNGGTFGGLPVIVSNSVPHSVSAGAIVALIVPQHINIADDGQVAIDASTEASLNMDSAPTVNSATPTATSLVSMFQTNSIAIRCERIINWQVARSYGVGYIDNMHTS